MNPLPPSPPQDNDPIITQFKPKGAQWELNEKNIKRTDNRTGTTILHSYCQHINTTSIEIFKYLIETKGCDVNIRDKNGDTPIHRAVRQIYPSYTSNIDVLKYLLIQKGINANIEGRLGYTLLHEACQNINNLPLEIFQYLIEILGSDVNAQDSEKNTPLHRALEYFNPRDGGNITVLNYLLNHKDVNVDIKDQFGYTILHTACININSLPIDIFKILIETLGGDVNAQDDDQSTPIHIALNCFDPHDGGDIDVLHYLLGQKKVNVNIKGEYGDTLLHITCNNINHFPFDVFKLLIETMGCDVNAQDNRNYTPLHIAILFFNPCSAGDIAVLTYLLDRNDVNVNIKTNEGRNLLHLACISQLSKSRDSPKQNAEFDTILCQIVEIIVERCIGEVLNEVTL